jgi:CO/xanthine dehydrogenase FAD-binding subunit
MRANVPAYTLERPGNLQEALAQLAQGDARPLAGGTDLMVVLEAGKLPPGRFISVWHLGELRGIGATEDTLSLGALTTYSEIQREPIVQSEFPLLAAAARETGAVAIQNRGTLGGNIANASPAADSPPALLCYDAELELVSAHGRRRVPYRTFHTGYKQTVLAPGELIAAIHLPRRPRGKQFFRKVGPRKAQAISKVCFAATGALEHGKVAQVAIALGSVAPVPVRASRTEAALTGRALDRAAIDAACTALASEIAPIDDIRSTGHYRTRVAANLLRDFLLELSGGALRIA